MTTNTDEAFAEVCDLVLDVALGQSEEDIWYLDSWECDHAYCILSALDVQPSDPNVSRYLERIEALFDWLCDYGCETEAETVQSAQFVASEIVTLVTGIPSAAMLEEMWNRS
jgi:hypothetical protein